MSNDIKIGSYVWAPCEVKPGPFSNERMVKITSSLGDWLGFAQTTSLKDETLEGQTQIKMLVLSPSAHKFLAKPAGEGLGPDLYSENMERMDELDLIPA